MKIYKILIPNVITENNYFETWEEAENTARKLLNQTNIKFISLFHKDELLTIIIKPGYTAYNFKSFKYLDELNKIHDYFTLQQEGETNFYIKLKP